MDVDLSKKQQILLTKALIETDGNLSTHQARQIYSSKRRALDSLQTLEFMEMIEPTKIPGKYRITGITDNVYAMIEKKAPDKISEIRERINKGDESNNG